MIWRDVDEANLADFMLLANMYAMENNTVLNHRHVVTTLFNSIQNKSHLVRVMYDNDKPIAIVYCGIYTQAWSGVPYAFVEYFYIHPKHRTGGCLRALFRKIERYAIEHNATQITMNIVNNIVTSRSIKALNYLDYKHVGYVVTKEI